MLNSKILYYFFFPCRDVAPAPTKPVVPTENKAVINMSSLPLNMETDVSVAEKCHKCNIIITCVCR